MFDPHEDPVIRALECIHLALWIVEIVRAGLRLIFGIDL